MSEEAITTFTVTTSVTVNTWKRKEREALLVRLADKGKAVNLFAVRFVEALQYSNTCSILTF